MVRIIEAGGGKGPNELFSRSSFQLPAKSGLSPARAILAAAEIANRVIISAFITAPLILYYVHCISHSNGCQDFLDPVAYEVRSPLESVREFRRLAQYRKPI